MSKAHTMVMKCQVQTPTTLLARVIGPDGEDAQTGTFDTLDIEVSGQRQGQVNLLTDQPASTYFYDTLQIDKRWEQDALGFNFELTLAAADFPAQDFYRAEIVLKTNAEGIVGRLVWEGGAISSGPFNGS